MLHKFLLTVFFIAWLMEAFTQSRGYVVIARGDSTVLKQAWINDNAQKESERYIYFSKGKELAPERYDKDSILEFGYDQGKRWIKKEILVNNSNVLQFLEVIEDGFYQLLFSKTLNNFYLDTDMLTELQFQTAQDNTFREQLTKLVDHCPNTMATLSNLKYKKASLQFLVENANHSKCSIIPVESMGVSVGIGEAAMNLSEAQVNNLIFYGIKLSGTSYEATVFHEAPIWGIKHISIIEKLTYNRTTYTGSKLDNNQHSDIRMDVNALQLAVSPRFILPFIKLRPYLEAGVAMSYWFKTTDELLRADFTGNNGELITLSEYKNTIDLSPLFYGYDIGTGIYYFYKTNRYLSLGVRMNQVYNSDHLKVTTKLISLSTNF